MATYKLGPASGLGRPTPQYRRPLVCESCLEALGSVLSPAVLTGMSAHLVAAMWPEMKVAVYQHEQKCQPPGIDERGV
jgi:hypothetical protein